MAAVFKINNIKFVGERQLNLYSDICGICREHILTKCVKCQDDQNSSCCSVLGECKHCYHYCCITEWTNKKTAKSSKCPTCNQVWELKLKKGVNKNKIKQQQEPEPGQIHPYLPPESETELIQPYLPPFAQQQPQPQSFSLFVGHSGQPQQIQPFQLQFGQQIQPFQTHFVVQQQIHLPFGQQPHFGQPFQQPEPEQQYGSESEPESDDAIEINEF